MRVVIVFGIVVSLIGCQDATLISKLDEITRQQTDSHKTLTELTEKNHQLEVRLAETTKCTEKVAALEEQWKRFEAAFLPEQRQIFEQNSQAAQQLLADLKATKEALLQECGKSREGMIAEVKATKVACDQALASLRIAVDDTAKLKEQCVQNAKEANDVNLVGALKESVSKLDQSVKGISTIDGKVTQVQSKITQLESSINFIKMDVQTAKTDVQMLRSKVK